MSEVVDLSVARASRIRAAQDRALTRAIAPVSDAERLQVLIESMKLAYQLVLELNDRLEAVEKANRPTHQGGPQCSLILNTRSGSTSPMPC